MEKEEILSQIKLQKENPADSPFKDYRNRIKALKLLKKNVLAMQDEIAEALKLDLNKSETESYMCETGMVLCEINYMIRHIRRLSKPQRVRTPLAQFPAKSYRIPCAFGQVLIISPWNYPFLLSVEPMVDAIAAGNSVVLKPSATSPNTQRVIKKLIDSTFNPREVTVVTGGREECSFLLDRDWDYVFFTGSARVGKTVLQKAAEHFTPVTLELGGKSPCIVDETANVGLAAKRIVFGKLLNCGQTCVAPDYIYCHKSIKEKLISELKKQIVLQYGTDPLKNENYPKMINERQYLTCKRLLKGTVIFGGGYDDELGKIQPTLMDSTFEDEEMAEEIFGPILPIVTYESADEAIGKLNSLPKPLAFYVFSSSKKNRDRFIGSCDFGGGCINDTVIHLASTALPFGGVGKSGMGSYHGKAGFDTFSHYKSIVDKKTLIDLPMRYQPFDKLKDKLIRTFMK
ncbi:MAG: aldehyde dehydrogenase [Christensenellales bacterium]